MNPTKSVKYIEVDSDIFEKIYDNSLDEKIAKIQQNFLALKNEVTEKSTEWMKLKDSEYYFDTYDKVLFPDTRNMRSTYLGMHVSDTFYGTILKLSECDEDTLNGYRIDAESAGMELPDGRKTYIFGNEASYMWYGLAESIFERKESCPLIGANGFITQGGKPVPLLITGLDGLIYNIVTGYSSYYRNINEALNIPVLQLDASATTFQLMLKYGLYPEQFGEDTVEALRECHDVVVQNVDFEDTEALKALIKENNISQLLGVDIGREAIEKDMQARSIDLRAESGTGYMLREYLNNCDYIRARIQKYSSNWYLSDEGKGHWELWTNQEPLDEIDADKNPDEADKNVKSSKILLQVKDAVIARNPVVDIKHDAIVGIDFGTKSTIVAMQDGGDQIVPLRVGMADYSVAPNKEHYENPTVMQFVDLGRFITQYNKTPGKPMTSWYDLLVSHEAFQNLISAENSMDIASFVTDLKQWAGGRYKDKNHSHLIIKDSKGYRYDVDDYMQLTSDDIDLVEIYAYYIGLFINNMHTGIYLDYVLSFPETFSKEIREHIINSFKNGIRKSIPEVVFENEEYAAEFRVRQGSSEPAAYAACALDQYGIEPTDKGVFYGIFDFGGGTTDYDYGMWKNAPEDELTYNYVIKHYGLGGDKTLGGENILQLLAYNVFSDDTKNSNGESNLDIMRKNKLAYYRPNEGKIVSGTEALNNNSECAMLNTKLMMEALRPIWEEWKEVQEWLSQGQRRKALDLPVQTKNVSVFFNQDSTVKVELLLFSEQGREQVTLNVDMAMVNDVINTRIESGVRNFFEGLVQAYKKVEKEPDAKIHVFLAGNSSKSPKVMQIFKKYAAEYNKLMFDDNIADSEIKQREKKSIVDEEYAVDKTEQNDDEVIKFNSIEKNHFVIYPPLGTREAKSIQKSRGIKVDENNLMEPTGKTGVAFGLIMCREGSMIKVESATRPSEQTRVNFYIGVNYRKNFKLIFDRNTEYGKWLRFSKISAGTETFEFYYSELPEVVRGNIPIRDNKSIYKRKCLVNGVNVDAVIYFRFTSPERLEYVVAADDKIDAGEYISRIYKVDL